MNKNKGFTLIELLVVIAIIGILSSVVLASLSSARNKGKDAAVKSQLSSMRAQAEIYYSATSTYTGICEADSTSNGFGGTGGLIAATISSEGVSTTKNAALDTAGSTALVTCHETADAWAVDAPLVTGSATTNDVMFCVDSAGASKPEAAAILGGITTCI